VTALSQFESNLAYVRNLLALARALNEATTEALDVGDIQRAAVVMAVSALDHYVHEKVRREMAEVLQGTRPQTDAFRRFPVSTELLLEARANPSRDDWLDDAVRAQHAHKPFLHTDAIADAIRLISPVKLWDAVAVSLGQDTTAVKARLKTIVDRRNKIAHEADLDPTQPGVRWQMTDQMACDAVDYIDRVVRAIDAAI